MVLPKREAVFRKALLIFPVLVCFSMKLFGIKRIPNEWDFLWLSILDPGSPAIQINMKLGNATKN